MYIRQLCNQNNRVRNTTLATISWLALILGWMVIASTQYSFIQNLSVLGMITLLYAGFTATIWVADAGIALTGIIYTTFGWLSFALYWMAFLWGEHTWLYNLAVLSFSFLGSITIIMMLLLGFNHQTFD